jgi:hypothetical protein
MKEKGKEEEEEKLAPNWAGPHRTGWSISTNLTLFRKLSMI